MLQTHSRTDKGSVDEDQSYKSANDEQTKNVN